MCAVSERVRVRVSMRVCVVVSASVHVHVRTSMHVPECTFLRVCVGTRLRSTHKLEMGRGGGRSYEGLRILMME